QRVELVGLRQEQGELLAADAGEAVHRPDQVAGDVAKAAEDVVPGAVAVAVVDALEVVEVEEDERDGQARATLAIDLLLEGLEQEAPVVEPCERVADRLVEPLLVVAHVLEGDRELAHEQAQQRDLLLVEAIAVGPDQGDEAEAGVAPDQRQTDDLAASALDELGDLAAVVGHVRPDGLALPAAGD